MSALDEASEFTPGAEIIPFDELVPKWTVPGATEGGYLRWLTSWVGGPEGYINPNFGRSIVSDKASVGFMKLMTGCRQKGVHAHTIVEIYIILKGHVESYDGLGSHFAGPMDCIYIPKGVPHAVRNVGKEDLDLLWVHDGIEKKGAATYYFNEAEIPKIGGVHTIRFMNLEPQWCAPKSTAAPFLRYIVNWVGGQTGYENFNPKVAQESDKVAMGILVIYPGNRQVPHTYPGNQCYVVAEGKALVEQGHGKGVKEVKRLDGIWIPGNSTIAIRNHGNEPLWVLWVHERPQKTDSAKYQLGV